MDPTLSMIARSGAAKDELRSICERHGADEMPEEVRQRADVLEAEIGRLNDAVRRQAVINDADRRATGALLNGSASASQTEVRAFEGAASPVPEAFDGVVLRTQSGTHVPILELRHKLATFLPPSESRASELGLGGFLRSLYHGPQTTLEKRVLAEASVGAGGAFVPAPLSAEVIDLLRARSVAFQAGARTIPMTSQTLRFARVTADPTGSWRAENSAITVADPTFDNITLTARSWALIVLVSRELLEDGTNVDQQLRNVFANAAALALDRAILYGTGTPPEPRGIVNTSGVQSISQGVNGANFGSSYAALLDAALALDSANAGVISAIILPPRTARYLSGMQDSSGQPMVMPARLSSIPLLTTTSMPITETQGSSSISSSVLLGDFTEVFVGVRTALQVSVLSERFASDGQVGFVCWLRADVGVARPSALAKIIGVIP